MSRPEQVLNKEPFRNALLHWFDGHHRELPWRHIDDPYAVWVSEVMLQQTRVTTVIDYFERWMKRFPEVSSLADADLEEVLELWSGLGYYRRARYLHQGARQVVEEHGGELPATVEQLRQLPGIGPYTAGAIASIAFGKARALVDGNVERVLTRLFAIEGDPKRMPAKGEIWSRAEDLVDPERPGDFNQAFMELGSLVCTAQNPGCSRCPVAPWCIARGDGEVEQYPRAKARSEPTPMRARACVVYVDQGDRRRFLLRRRPDGGLLGGLWEFPTMERHGVRWPLLREFEEYLARAPGLMAEEIEITRALGTLEHVFSHRRMRVRVHEVRLDGTPPPTSTDDDHWRWVDGDEIGEIASAALVDRIESFWSSHR